MSRSAAGAAAASAAHAASAKPSVKAPALGATRGIARISSGTFYASAGGRTIVTQKSPFRAGTGVLCLLQGGAPTHRRAACDKGCPGLALCRGGGVLSDLFLVDSRAGRKSIIRRFVAADSRDQQLRESWGQSSCG